MNTLLQLRRAGQSVWLDNLTRRMIRSGELQRRVKEDGLAGVTSNPEIFHRAISAGDDYDAEIQQTALKGRPTSDIYSELVVSDVRDACDALRPRYDETDRTDGFVSLEVSPHLAHDTEASMKEAQRLWTAVDRPNLMIKIPGTAEGVPALEECLFQGVNINVTLLFAITSYQAVADAYLRALERRVEAGRQLSGLSSVASFFLSRIDVLVDQLLGQRLTPDSGSGAAARALLGKAAVASAKLAYHHLQQLLESPRWRTLAERGARPQRLLWASTGTKNPTHSDVKYVEPLIGPLTVSTMPERTLAAFADHGRVSRTVDTGLDQARQDLRDLRQAGIRLEQVTWQLENEGVQKFIEPYDRLLSELESKRERFLHRQDRQRLQEVARRLRRLVLRMTTEAGSGHPTSCLSAADLVAALFFHEMRWDPTDASARNVDRFILSKGHAAPLLWAALAEAGALAEDPMSLRQIDSSLEGHPTPRNPWVQVSTGSLGQGLAAANGICLANRLDGIPARVYCLLGDGECSEGSVWEAAQFAALNELTQLTAIIDVNALGQSAPTPYQHQTSVFAERFRAFGWTALEIDGHNMAAILDALQRARLGGPTAIIARTEKGKGVSLVEGAQGWHGKVLSRAQLEVALRELGEPTAAVVPRPRRVGEVSPQPKVEPAGRIQVAYPKGAHVATREGYGRALDKISRLDHRIVALDGDVRNSTKAQLFMQGFPERAFESYISEQNMVGTALGLAVSGKLPFVATFAAFLTRAHDFIRMAGHSHPEHLVFCGSHCGVSVGEDGPSQMGLEDLAMFRAIIQSTVLYPCDAVSAERLTELAAHTRGIVYLRTTRPETPVIYPDEETFAVGGSKTLRASPDDSLAIIAAGITVHEALAAHQRLAQRGIAVRVIDAYSVKPLDSEAVNRAARETRGLIVVEDHAVEGGLGEAVAAEVRPPTRVALLGIRETPRSGKAEELLERHGIDCGAIERKALELLVRPG